MALLNSPSSKSPIWTRDRVSSPSRSHFSPGLKLILRTQVTNPEHGRFQSLSKGVYGFHTNQSLLVTSPGKQLQPTPLNLDTFVSDSSSQLTEEIYVNMDIQWKPLIRDVSGVGTLSD